MMEYKGYQAAYENDDEEGIFYARVVNIADFILFEADTMEQLYEEFRVSIDDYLAWCAEDGKEPDKPFTKGIRIKMSETIYNAAEAAAKADGKGLDAWLAEMIENAVTEKSKTQHLA